MKILAIDTSCDETAAAVTEGVRILSNVIWSQASLHAKWGGIVPSLAQRAHRERIEWVIEKAMQRAKGKRQNLGAVAVTVGPGLAIALEVGIERAKQLALEWHKPLIAVNHVEGHVVSPLAQTAMTNDQLLMTKLIFPAMALVVSGGHTELIWVEEIGLYKILARTMDDALGEALDKAARMLGLGYPGGPVLEKMAKLGNSKAYPLPLPMLGREEKNRFSYSGLKAAFVRLIEKEKPLSAQKIYNLAASFQNIAFEHLLRIANRVLAQNPVKDLLVGGGVAANIELRQRLRKLARNQGFKVHFPYSKNLCTDNAAMIGVAAYFKAQRDEFVKDIASLDRDPSARVDQCHNTNSSTLS